MKKILSKFTNIVSWFLVTAFAIQLFSSFSSFIISNEFTNSISLPFFRFFEALGAVFSSNWLPFSIMFGIAFVFGIFKSQINSQKDNSNHFMNFILTCLNLLMCNQLYNIDIFRERVKYYADNIWIVIGVVIILAMIPLIGYGIKNLRDSKKLIEKSKNDNANTNNGGVNNSSGDVNDTSWYDLDKSFMIRHPILHRWEQFKYNYALYHEKKLQAKTEAKIQKMQSETNNKTNNVANEIHKIIDNKSGISGIIAVLIVIFINIFLFKWIFFQDFPNDTFINGLLTKIKVFVVSSTKYIGGMEDHSLNWLMVFGTVFFILVIFILCDYFLYFSLRVFLYFIVNFSEDSKIIKRFSLQLKTFFAGALDDAMRLLLFFPDFLEVIEDFMLDTDIDEMVKERFSDYPKINESSLTTDEKKDHDKPDTSSQDEQEEGK